MRRLKPTQCASGPKLIDSANGFAVPAAPAAARAICSVHRTPFVPCTAVDPRRSTFSLVSNYTLYNVAGIRLNIAKSWRLNQHPTLKGGTHETPFRRMCLRCRLADRRRDRRARAGQRPSNSSCRTGCRHRIRCRRRWKNGAPRSRRIPAAPSNTRFIRRSSSARRSTITTWRATASPTSPTSIPAISPAASRSSAPANCRS